jgi:hypothetical protein
VTANMAIASHPGHGLEIFGKTPTPRMLRLAYNVLRITIQTAIDIPSQNNEL